MSMPSSLRPKNKQASGLNNPISSLRPKQKQETTFQSIGENLKEIPGQFLKGQATGALSTAGNLFDILGLQSKESLPGEKQKRESEFDVLQKMQKGEPLSHGEFLELSDDDILPYYSRLPTSPETKSFLEEFGAPKAKRIGGRFAERIGEFTGSPGGGLKAAIGAGVAGQAAEELGAPAWVQAAAEIGTALKLSKSKTPISSSNPKIEKELNTLREMGYSDKDLTLARNALEDRGFLKKSSKYTKEAENKFKSSLENSKTKVDEIIESGLPGFTKEGPQKFQRITNELFENLDNLATQIRITNPEIYIKNADKAINKLEKTLAITPQKKQVIELLQKSIENSADGLTGDFYTTFYKDLNTMGNWGNPKEREYVFKTVKDAIKDTFRAQGKEGVKLAEALENANESHIRYLNAKDVAAVLEKVSTEDGINYKKFKSALEKPENMQIFKEAVGSKQAKNLLKLSEVTSEIENLEKSIKGGFAKDLLGQGTLYGIAKGILTGDFQTLKTIASIQLGGRLATKLLTDESYQNLAIRMANAAKDQNWNIVKALTFALEKKTKNDLVSPKDVNSKNYPK